VWQNTGEPLGFGHLERILDRPQNRSCKMRREPSGIYNGIRMTKEQKGLIAARIREFLESPPTDSKLPLAISLDSSLRATASRLNVLPLVLDMGGCLAIGLDGEIRSFVWDETDIQIEHDERIRNLALFQGSRKYPELEFLAPARPPDAAECHHCKGTGKAILFDESGLPMS